MEREAVAPRLVLGGMGDRRCWLWQLAAPRLCCHLLAVQLTLVMGTVMASLVPQYLINFHHGVDHFAVGC